MSKHWMHRLRAPLFQAIFAGKAAFLHGKVTFGVPIRTLKFWNEVMGASHYRTGCSRKNEKRSIRRSTHAALSWGFVPRWSPSQGRTHFPGQQPEKIQLRSNVDLVSVR